MKTRNGFVSNSSSSSFVVISSKSAHEKALAHLKTSSKYEDAVDIIKKWAVMKRIGNEELILIAGHRYEDGMCSHSHKFTGLEITTEGVGYIEDYDEIDAVSSILYEYMNFIRTDANSTSLNVNC